jgi:DNA-binding SARP family transcriptional activator
MSAGGFPQRRHLVIEICTLGSVEVRDLASGQPITALHHPRPLSLLVLLALQEGPVRRDTLLPLFWPESSESRSRHALRQLMLRVRHASSAELLVSLNSQAVQLREGSVRCDAVTARRAAREGRREDALHIYAGEFLAGFHVPGAPDFEDWQERTRRELHGMAVEAARGLMREAAAAGRATDARLCAERLLELEPYDEANWREYLLLLARDGQSGLALAAFRRLADRMQVELGVQPCAATLALARSLWPEELWPHRNVMGCGTVAPVAHGAGPPGREWERLQEQAVRLSRRTLESVKQRSGLPFGVTVPRRSCLRHLERFLRSDARATALIGPAGCGKSIALAHAAERLWLGRAPAYPDDVLWYVQAEDLLTVAGGGFQLPGLLHPEAWFGGDDELGTYFDSHVEAIGGRVILLLDGLDGRALDLRALDALTAQVLGVVASSRHPRFRVVVAMRPPGWQRLAARVERASALARAWYGVRWDAEEEDLRNVPPLRRSEMRRVIRRWSRGRGASATLAGLAVTPMLREPGYLQLFLQAGFPSTRVDEGRLVENYLDARVFAGPDGASRAELLAEFLRLGRYGRISTVERRRLRSRPRRRVAAYDDLRTLGILRERQQRGEDGLPVAVVTAGQPQVLDCLVVRHWIAADGGLTTEMLRRMVERYAGTTLRIELLEWVARIAMRDGAFAALEEIFELPLETAELDHLSRAVGCMLRQHDDARSWLLPRWAERSSGRRHYFESFVDQDYLVLQLAHHLPCYIAAATDRQALVFGHAMMLLASLLRLDGAGSRTHRAALDDLAPDADVHPLPLGRAMAYRLLCHHLLEGAVPPALLDQALAFAAAPPRATDRFASFPVYHLFLVEALNLCGMTDCALDVIDMARGSFPNLAEHRDRTVFYRLLLTHEAMAQVRAGRVDTARRTLHACAGERALHSPRTYPSFHYAALQHRLAAAEIDARSGSTQQAIRTLEVTVGGSRALGFALFEALALGRLAPLYSAEGMAAQARSAATASEALLARLCSTGAPSARSAAVIRPAPPSTGSNSLVDVLGQAPA